MKIYKNGKVVLKYDKITVIAAVDDHQCFKITLDDRIHRYTYFRFLCHADFGGDMFDQKPYTNEDKFLAVNREMESYLKVRGNRTSWTPWKERGLYQGI